jgi:hypothetical protein
MRSIILLLFFFGHTTFCLSNGESSIEDYNVIWDSPSNDSWASMPIGNGDIGSNVWVSPDGVLHFYISKTDAFSENGRLLKIGKASVKFTPNVFPGENFKQELDIESGCIKISSDQADLLFFVDANNPAIVISGECVVPVQLEVNYDGWRNQKRQLSDLEMHSARALIGGPDPVIVNPDTVLSTENGILWCHNNKTSVYEMVLEGVDLRNAIDENSDPLVYRTFGAHIFGDKLVSKGSGQLVSKSPSKSFRVNTLVLTETASTIDSWAANILNKSVRVEREIIAKHIKDHNKWWNEFWERHYIFIDSEKEKDDVFKVTQGYLLQRYMNACSGRGNMPIKFNGSIFNVDVAGDVAMGDKNLKGLNADYRNWGGCYWWQNTRLPYWSMLYSGDFQLMLPLFEMYMDALDLSKLATREYFNHKGAHFPETMYFWGTYGLTDYGWERDGLEKGITQNEFIRYYWQGGLELVAMMQEYYLYTGDKKFLNDVLAVFAKEILTFYDEHYSKNNSGKIVISPAHSLETYWHDVINPLPEIAGLTYVTGRFLAEKGRLEDVDLRSLCERIQPALPEIPLKKDEERNTALSPAQHYNPKIRNFENPELYAIFPYLLYGVGKDNLEFAHTAYENRRFKQSTGWQQDAIQAALIGKTEEAKKLLVDGFNTKHEGSKFPAFWGPNADWIPDQDHGSVYVRALQNMLIQEVGDSILLMPAFPSEWDADFKIYASRNTVIEGKYQDGKFEELSITPKSRKKDLVIRDNSDK